MNIEICPATAITICVALLASTVILINYNIEQKEVIIAAEAAKAGLQQCKYPVLGYYGFSEGVSWRKDCPNNLVPEVK